MWMCWVSPAALSIFPASLSLHSVFTLALLLLQDELLHELLLLGLQSGQGAVLHRQPVQLALLLHYQRPVLKIRRVIISS